MKKKLTPKWHWILVLSVFALAVAGGYAFARYKYFSLSYHTDFSWYLQFAAKLFDPSLTNRFTYNPNGHNFFGLVSYEGSKGFHASIHLEPIKYVYAVIYALFGGPLPVLFFFTALYFSPLLYFAKVHPAKNREEQLLVGLFALAYVALPAAFLSATNDLRPRMLLNVAIPLAAFSILYRRPLKERLMLFSTLFLLREEGLIFGLIFLGFQSFYTLGRPDHTKETIAYGSIWLLALILSGVLYVLPGFEYWPEWNSFYTLAQNNKILVLGIGIGIVYLLLIAALIYFDKKSPAGKPGWLQKLLALKTSSSTPAAKLLLAVFAYLLIFIPILGQLAILVNENSAKLEMAGIKQKFFIALELILSSEHLTILWVTLIVMLILVWQFSGIQQVRKGILITFGLVCVVGAGYSVKNVSAFISQRGAPLADTRLLFDLRQETDRYETGVLTGYSTYQVFFDFENAYIFQRLPWFVVSGDERYFRQNLPYLEQLIQEEIHYVVIARRDTKRLDPVLEEIGIVPLEETANDTFVIYQLK